METSTDQTANELMKSFYYVNEANGSREDFFQGVALGFFSKIFLGGAKSCEI